MSSRRRWLRFNLTFVSLLTLLAFALRLHNLGSPSLWYDELLELDVAQGSFSHIWPQLERHAAMPLDYCILYGWVKLGRQEAWVRFPALFFGVLAVPLIYRLATCLFNRRVGYLASLLLALASFSIRYSQEVRPYALLLSLVMVGYLGLWQAYHTRRLSYWGLAIVGLTGAALTHYFTLFMLLPMGLFVGCQQLYHLKQKKFWQQTACFAVSVLLVCTIFTLTGRLRHLYNVGTRFSTVISQPETLTVPALEKPNRGSGPPLSLDFFVTNALMPLATSDGLLLLIYNAFFLLAPLSLLQLRRTSSRREAHPHLEARSRRQAAVLLLLGWLFLPTILIYFFLLQRGTFFAVRYILYTLPAYLILVAYGLDTLVTYGLSRSARVAWPEQALNPKKLLLNGLLLLALIPLIFAELNELLVYYAADAREDWRAVGQLLQANAGPDDVVIAVRAEPVINWYYPPAQAPFGTFGRSEPIWQALREHKRRWFVLSSYSYKRDEGLRNWLAEQQAVVIAIDRRVVVYFHQEGLSAEELLAQARSFTLPQKALTYTILADQFKRSGDLETSQVFYQKALELTSPGL